MLSKRLNVVEEVEGWDRVNSKGLTDGSEENFRIVLVALV